MMGKWFGKMFRKVKHDTTRRRVQPHSECGYCNGIGGSLDIWSGGVEFTPCRACDGEGVTR